MTKQYCDFCQKETDNLTEIIIIGKGYKGKSYSTLNFYNRELCIDCYKKTIEKMKKIIKEEK